MLFFVIDYTVLSEFFAHLSSFAYGTFEWTLQTNGQITLDLQQAWRWTAWFNSSEAWSDNLSINVGDVFFTDPSIVSVNPTLKVLNKNIDILDLNAYWFFAQSNGFVVQPSATAFDATFENCCRISTLQENNNGIEEHHGVGINLLNTLRTSGLSTTGFPRETAYLNENWPYITTISDFDLNKSIQFYFSPSNSSNRSSPDNSRLTRPIPCGQVKNIGWYDACNSTTGHPQLSLDTNTGAATWYPTIPGGYAISIAAKIVDSAESGGSTPTWVNLDFVILVVVQCPTTDTTCNHAPYYIDYQAIIPCTATVPTTVTIHVADQDLKDTLQLQNSPPPTGLSLSSSTVAGTATTTPTGYWTFNWLSSIDSVNIQLCIKAVDSQGLSTAGNTCPLFQVVFPDYLYVLGTLRIWSSSYTSADGFNTNTALGGNAVQSSLDSSRKPVWSPVPNLSQSVFDSWWSDDISSHYEIYLYTVTLIRYWNNQPDSAGVERIYSYRNTTFWAADDTLSTSQGTNRYFTYEVHSSFDYLGTETLQFAAAGGEMWVFMNNALLLFIEASSGSTTQTISSSQMAGAGMTAGDTYNVDVFYAHRSGSVNPKWNVEWANSTKCSAITLLAQSGTSIPYNIDFSSGFINSQMTMSSNVAIHNGQLQLLTSDQLHTSSSAWFALTVDNVKASSLLNILSGFQTTFSFNMECGEDHDAMDGFAFVIQSTSPTARGSDGAGLGYSGLSNSIAIEFDTRWSSTYDDVFLDQHISVHTGYTTMNSAVESSKYWPLGSQPVVDLPKLPFTFDNGTDHLIRVELSPGSVYSYLYVYVNQNIRPLYSAQLNTAQLAAMFQNGAYVGFTAGASEFGGDVIIKNWRLLLIPPDAGYTGPITGQSSWTTIAGTNARVDIQLRDACDQPLDVIGETSMFSASLSDKWRVSQAVSIVPVDSSQGIYTFYGLPTKTDTYILSINLTTTAGTHYINNRPNGFPITVTPAQNVAANSYFTFSTITPGINNVANASLFNQVSGAGTACLAFDRNGAATKLGQQFTAVAAFNTWVASESFVVCTFYGDSTNSNVAASINQACGGSLSFTTQTSAVWIASQSSGSWSILNSASSDVDIATLAYSVVLASGNVRVYAEAAQKLRNPRAMILVGPDSLQVPTASSGAFYLLPRDKYNNYVTSVSQTITYTFSPDLGASTTNNLGCNAFATGNPALLCGFNTGPSGNYLLNVYTAGVPVPLMGDASAQAGTVLVTAGAASYLTSKQSGLTIATRVDQATTFQVILYDVQNNQVLTQPTPEINNVTFVSTTDSSVTFVLTDYTTQLVWSQAQQQYNIQYTPTIAGQFYVKVYVNGHEMVSSANLNVAINPGDPSALRSYILEDSQTDGVFSTAPAAGTSISYTIQARDKYGNDCTNIPSIYSFAVAVAGTGAPSSITFSNGGAGQLKFILTPTQTVQWTVTATLSVSGGTATLIQRNSAGTLPATFSFTAVPGAISELSTFSLLCPKLPCGSVADSIYFTAGDANIPFQLTLYDLYQNPIVATQSSATISSAISINLQTTSSSTYALIIEFDSITQTAANSNVYTGTLTAHIASPYSITVVASSSAESLVISPPSTLTVLPAQTDMLQVQSRSSYPQSVSIAATTDFTIIDVDHYGNLRSNLSQTFNLATSGLGSDFDTSASCSVQDGPSATYTCAITLDASAPTTTFQLTTSTPSSVYGESSFTNSLTSYKGTNVLYARVETVTVRGVSTTMYDSSGNPTFALPSFFSGESVTIVVAAYEYSNYTGAQPLDSAPSLTLSPNTDSNSIWTTTSAAGSTVNDQTTYTFTVTLNRLSDSSTNYEFVIALASIKSQINSGSSGSTVAYVPSVLPGDLSPPRSSFASSAITLTAGDQLSVIINPKDVNGNTITSSASFKTIDTATNVISDIIATISQNNPTFDCSWIPAQAYILCSLTPAPAQALPEQLIQTFFYTAGLRTLGFSYNGAAINSRVINLTVKHGPIDLSKSYLSIAGTLSNNAPSNTITQPYVANNQSLLYFIAYDSYSNAVSDLANITSASLSLSVPDPSILSASLSCSWAQNATISSKNMYSNCINFNTYSRSAIAVSITNGTVSTPPISVYVRSGIPASRTSTSLNTTFVPSGFGLSDSSGFLPASSTRGIDANWDFVLTIQDPNGVPFLYDLADAVGDQNNVKLSAYRLASDGTVAAYVTATVTSWTAVGTWSVSLDSTGLTKTGTYYLDVQSFYGSVVSDVALYSFTVTPGNPYLPRTTFGALPTVVVGTSTAASNSYFTFTLSDKLGNVITDAVPDLYVYLRSGSVSSCTDFHDQALDVSLPVAPESEIYLTAESPEIDSTGTYSFAVNGTKARTYTYYLTYNATGTASDNALQCTQLVSLAFTVNVGLTDAATSTYLISASSALPSTVDPSTSLQTINVGVTYYIFIQMKDSSGNLIQNNDLDSDDIFAFEAGPDAEEPSASAGLSVPGQTVTVANTLNYQSIGYSNGVWRIAFVAQKTYASAEFAVYIRQKYADGTPSAINRITGSQNGIESPQTAVVLHAAPVSISWIDLPNSGDMNVTAGISLAFTLGTYDYLNNYVDDNTLHYAQTTINRIGSTYIANGPDIDSYYFQPNTTTTSDGLVHFSFTPAWEGVFEVTTTMYNKKTNSYINETALTLYVAPATCAAQYLATHPTATASEIPAYRCQSTNECVHSYADCSATVDQTSCATGYTRCTDTSTTCVLFSACAASAVKCADGSYVPTAADCPIVSPCPSGQVQCPNDTTQCRSTVDDCPSPVACPPGLVVCPNQLTCATSVAQCPVITTADRQSCAATFSNGVVCPDGSCVAYSSECSTGVTCPDNQVLCLTDKSCRANATVCPSSQEYNDIQTTATCAANNQVLCWDSSCAANANSCPSRITCPVGYSLCPDSQCVSSADDCSVQADLVNELDSSSTSLACTLDSFRCPDGSCEPNVLLCPSQPSCTNDLPVLCSDLTCKASLALCTVPSTCATGEIRCPSSGQCVSDTTYCTKSKSCPPTAPTLCASTRTCVSDIAQCSSTNGCSSALPYSCPSSGSCRASISDCPTISGCPSTSPLMCPDGSCRVDLNLCISSTSSATGSTTGGSSSSSDLSCPADHLSCSTGECIPKNMTALGCPSHITCPADSQRCADGTCRTSCSNVASASCANQGLISCPISGSGVACAASLSECPRGVTCPLSAPVKCLDASCALTLDSCPPLPTSTPPSSKIPCPDNSWAYDTCPTAVTCPDRTPFTCYDQTCKTSLDQCPTPTPCDPTSATPYRCSTGACAATPWDCGSIDGTVCNSGNQLVKCPLLNGISQCVVHANDCPVVNTTSSSGDDVFTSTCPAGFYYCRDGSCAETATNCPVYTCSLSYPYLCADGSCAATSSQCPATNGCPWDTPVKCPGVGSCVARLRECPAPACPANELACPDGSCGASCLYTASGCTSSQHRCADGTCVDSYDLCTSQSNSDFANSCLPGAPYKCSSGLCVPAQSDCPTLDNSVCPDTKPVLCADGLCRASLDLCPIMKPCLSSQTRCGNGECRDSADECPTQDTCPGTEFRCKQTDFTSMTILDGICSNTDGQCFADNGCPITNPIVAPHRCDNGRCVTDSSQCNASLRLANGCVSNSTWTSPVKCWNGVCAQSTATCPSTNGCPATTPFRCSNGACIADASQCPVVTNSTTGATQPATCDGYTCADGSCVAHGDTAQCTTTFGCPVTAPFRCADGTCKKYSAAYRAPKYGLTTAQINEYTCQPTVYCTSDSYTMCEDGQCVLSASQCSAVSYTCSGTQVRCLDGTCADSYEHCGMVEETDSSGQVVTDSDGNPVWTGSSTTIATCPSAAPVICPDGGCVTTMADCSTNTIPSLSTITGSSSSAKPTASNNTQSVLCFDGSYRSSYKQCIAFAQAVYNMTDYNGEADSSDACNGFCPDGSCILGNVTAAQACDIVQPCGLDYYRCFDGSCRKVCVASAGEVVDFSVFATYDSEEESLISAEECDTSNGQALCIDGICRPIGECPNYDGCGYQENYHYRCSSHECASGPTTCSSASVRNADDYARLLLREATIDQTVNMVTTSLVETPNSLVSAFVTAATASSNATTSTKSCSGAGCIAHTNVYSTSIQYNPNRQQTTYAVAPLATGFSLVLSSGLTVNQSQDVNIYVEPVADNVYFNASNKVTYSRVSSFGSTLTAAQTLLSPAFSCSVGAGISQPFSTSVGVKSLIDRSSSPKPAPADVCLARLRRYPEHNYATWECLFTNDQRTSGNSQYTIRQTSTAALNQASSYITTCLDLDLNANVSSGMSTQADSSTQVPAVYAFIHSPIQTGQVYTQPATSWWNGNVIWVIIVAILAVLALFSLIYAVSRLSRYKSKTEQVKEEIEVMEREVDDLENYGGRRYDGGEVAYTANPMAQSLEAQQELQKMTDADRLQLQKENLAKQQAESIERQEVIQQLEDANAQELAMLEATRAKLQQNQRRRVE